MAIDYSQLNVRQKLAKARLSFLNEHVNKSGKHLTLEFTYYELKDIVPPALRIFAKIGLVYDIEITREHAKMTILNTDNLEEEGVVFSIPYAEMTQIISKSGKVVTNPVQSLGSSVTYLTRYLWMSAMGITEPDTIEPNIGNESSEEEEETPIITKRGKKAKTPATPEERKTAKEELVSGEEQANEEQITSLKNLCKTLMEKDENQEEFVQKIALKTEGFTNILSSTCIELCKNLVDMIAEYN